jgi:hypothetical protein
MAVKATKKAFRKKTKNPKKHEKNRETFFYTKTDPDPDRKPTFQQKNDPDPDRLPKVNPAGLFIQPVQTDHDTGFCSMCVGTVNLGMCYNVTIWNNWRPSQSVLSRLNVLKNH